MKVLEKKELSIKGTCPHCKSKLLIEKGDVHIKHNGEGVRKCLILK